MKRRSSAYGLRWHYQESTRTWHNYNRGMTPVSLPMASLLSAST